MPSLSTSTIQYDPTHRDTVQVVWQELVQWEKCMAPNELIKLLRTTAVEDVQLYLLAKIALELQRIGDFIEAERKKENGE